MKTIKHTIDDITEDIPVYDRIRTMSKEAYTTLENKGDYKIISEEPDGTLVLGHYIK